MAGRGVLGALAGLGFVVAGLYGCSTGAADPSSATPASSGAPTVAMPGMPGMTSPMPGVSGMAGMAGMASPTPSTTSAAPPLQQRTVAAGTTLHAGDGSRGSAPAGHQHGDHGGHGRHGSTVPNGTGSYPVAVPNADGCDHSYGTRTQCVPLRAPGGGRMTCAVLRDNDYLPLLITRDRLGLVAANASKVRRVHGRTYLTGCEA